MKITVHKIASVTKNVPLKKTVEISKKIVSKSGYLLVVKVLENKRIYNQLELRSGRFSTLRKDDLLIVALGQRKALKGFVGKVPEKIQAGDIIHLLNLGGVAGICMSENRMEVGRALRVEVIGAVLDKNRKPLHIGGFKLFNLSSTIHHDIPLIILSGTCMNVGKTTAAGEVIRGAAKLGYKIFSAKLAGIAALKDLKNMQDCGAQKTISLIDAGYPSTVLPLSEGVELTKGAINYLGEGKPDFILIEFGDGILGEYGVLDILKDKELQKRVLFHIGCAYDPLGALKLAEIAQKISLPLHMVSGPITDNSVGVRFIDKNLGLPAINAVWDGERMFPCLLESLKSLKKQ